EVPQLGRGELLGGSRAVTGRVLREARDIAEITRDGVRTIPGLESEVIAELLEAKRSGYWGGWRRRRTIHITITTTSTPATMARTELTRRIMRTTSSRFVPNPTTKNESAVTPREPIDGRARSHIRHPGQDENQPRVHHAATRQERAEGDGHVGGNRRKDVFEGGQHRDQRVQRAGGKLLEKREKVRQVTERPPLGRGWLDRASAP